MCRYQAVGGREGRGRAPPLEGPLSSSWTASRIRNPWRYKISPALVLWSGGGDPWGRLASRDTLIPITLGVVGERSAVCLQRIYSREILVLASCKDIARFDRNGSWVVSKEVLAVRVEQ